MGSTAQQPEKVRPCRLRLPPSPDARKTFRWSKECVQLLAAAAGAMFSRSVPPPLEVLPPSFDLSADLDQTEKSTAAEA